MSQKKGLIFCMAPLHVKIIVEFLTCHGDEYDTITIVCRNNNLYKFFKELNYNYNFVVLDKRISSKWLYLYPAKMRRLYVDDLKALSIYQRYDDVIFTSIYIGTYGYYLKLLHGLGGKLILLKSLTVKEVKRKLTFRQRIDLLIKSKCFGIRLSPCFQGENIVYRFPLEDYQATCMDVKGDIPSDKKINPLKKVDYKGKTAIVFANPYRDKFHSEDDYNNLFSKLIDYLHSEDYYVCLKGHPRIGVLECISKKVDYTIPQYIPAEFLDYSAFSLAVGLTTTSLCDLTIPSYSLLGMVDVTDQEAYKYWIDYIQTNGKGHVRIIDGFNKIKKTL